MTRWRFSAALNVGLAVFCCMLPLASTIPGAAIAGCTAALAYLAVRTDLNPHP